MKPLSLSLFLSLPLSHTHTYLWYIPTYMMKRLRNIFRELRKTGSHPGCTTAHLYVLHEQFSGYSKMPHAGASVAETSCSEVDVVDTG